MPIEETDLVMPFAPASLESPLPVEKPALILQAEKEALILEAENLLKHNPEFEYFISISLIHLKSLTNATPSDSIEKNMAHLENAIIRAHNFFLNIEEEKTSLILKAEKLLEKYPEFRKKMHFPLINLRWSNNLPRQEIARRMSVLSNTLKEIDSAPKIPTEKISLVALELTHKAISLHSIVDQVTKSKMISLENALYQARKACDKGAMVNGIADLLTCLDSIKLKKPSKQLRIK